MIIEPLDIYDRIQYLVIQDARAVVDEMLTEDKFQTSNTQAHSHNDIDSPSFPFGNLSDAVQYAAIQRITLTPAQIKALNSTPVTLLRAPVPNNLYNGASTKAKIITIVTGIAAYLNYAGTPYTGTHALEFRYTNASGAKVTSDMSNTFLNSSGSAYDYAPGVSTELVPVANTPIIVTVGTANPAAGTSPITFVIHYRTIAFQ